MDVPFLCPQKALPAFPNLLQQAVSSLHSSRLFHWLAHLKSISRSMLPYNLLQHRIPTARSLIWSGSRRSQRNSNECDPYYRGLHLCPISNKKSNQHRFTVGGDTIWASSFFLVGQISMCTVNAWSPPASRRPLAPSRGFQNTVAAWLKQRSPRQVNNQPTQSAVCDRFQANKAFSYSLLRGSTRQGLSDCSLLITINL